MPGGGNRTPRDRLSGHRVHFEYAYDDIIGQHRDSLTRLGLPSVDSLTIHDADYGHQSPDQLDAILGQLSPTDGRGATTLEELRDAGLTKAIGAGCNREMRNYDSWEGGKHEDLIERIVDAADLDFLVVAGPYTLLDTLTLRRVLPLCAERQMGVIIAATYAGGWLVAPDRIPYMYGDVPCGRERQVRTHPGGLRQTRGATGRGGTPVSACPSRRRRGDPGSQIT
jgi:D-threo-aldose 1-dehydrogenase